MRAPGLATAAAAVLALEGAALVVFAIIELMGLGAGDAASLPTAIALIVLTLIGAAALLAFAVGRDAASPAPSPKSSMIAKTTRAAPSRASTAAAAAASPGARTMSPENRMRRMKTLDFAGFM